MILKTIILKNFRSYKDETRIDIDKLTTFIGKNDVGKSSILEALEIFFNNSLIKIEADDACVTNSDKEVTIGCVFSDFEDDIIIDSTATTTLQSEYLLNSDGLLEIHKVYNCDKKLISPATYALANYPSNKNVNDLLYLKNVDLKKRISELGIIDSAVNKSSNVSIRQGIYKNYPNLQFSDTLIDLEKEDAKKIWTKLKDNLPIYAFFRSDRPSSDEDSEVQDPMKLAIDEVVREIETQLEEVKKLVKEKATLVAEKTIEKLNEMDPTLAQQLNPNFRVEPKWSSIFKLSLTDDKQVPINKRGSGVRRLILISFFRAHAERKQQEVNATNIIYAIEEPETSQHPNNQEMLIKVLVQLANSEKAQVLLTTHVPALASFIPLSSIRFITKDASGGNCIEYGTDDPSINQNLYDKACKSLGILPETKIKLLLCLEGPNDVNFFKIISNKLHQSNSAILDLSISQEVAFLPLGGSTLKQWVEMKYLEGLNKPQVHIYDRDDMVTPEYQRTCDQINARNDNSWATLTTKRTIENYLHPKAINEVLGITVSFSDSDNVVEIVSKCKWESENSGKSWETDCRKNRKKRFKNSIKQILNNEVAKKMTKRRIDATDSNHDIENWLNQVSSRI